MAGNRLAFAHAEEIENLKEQVETSRKHLRPANHEKRPKGSMRKEGRPSRRLSVKMQNWLWINGKACVRLPRRYFLPRCKLYQVLILASIFSLAFSLRRRCQRSDEGATVPIDSKFLPSPYPLPQERGLLKP